MPIKVSHGAFEGEFSAWTAFKRNVLQWKRSDPLTILEEAAHNGGSIEPDDALQLADRLDEVVDILQAHHRDMALQFATACRRAAVAGESLKFE